MHVLEPWCFNVSGRLNLYKGEGGGTRRSKKTVVALDLLSLHPTKQRMAKTNHRDHLICTVRISQ